jgi:hypothetical protein
LQEPLPISAFASLTSIDVRTIREVLAALEPLLAGQQQGAADTVHPASSMFHLSFLEYLRSPATPPDIAFPIDTFTSHSRLGLTCLEELRRILTCSESAFTSPVQKYATRYWPVHTAQGTAAVTPASDIEWKATPHSTILDSIYLPQWQRWANSYLRLVHPGTLEEVTLDELAVSPAVEMAKAKHIYSRRTIRGVWDRLTGKPAPHGVIKAPANVAPKHPLSGIVEFLLEYEGTPGTAAVADVAVRLQHRNWKAWLDLGKAYRHVAESGGSSHLLDSAVDACRYAATLRNCDDHDICRMLAWCLWLRFERLGMTADLEEAIALERVALSLTPPGHP